MIFCIWNMNGVNEPEERGKVLSPLKNGAHQKLRLISEIYHSKFSLKSRGAAIYVIYGGSYIRHRKNIHFILGFIMFTL